MAQFLTPIRKGVTIGEKRFAGLLKKYLNDDYLIWQDAPTSGSHQRFPDFLIFNPDYGLWSIEIKDWSMGNVKKITPEMVTLKQGENTKNYNNPIIQARHCLLPVVNQLNKDKSLLQKYGKHQGNLTFPWAYGAVMTNWNYQSIPDKYIEIFDRCFPNNKVFFKEELLENSSEKDKFIEKLHSMLPYKFSKGLTKKQVDKVRAYIFPEFIIEQGDLFAEDENIDIDTPNVVTIMDNIQETLARNMGDGHRVIHGVAGSGKTLILEHRAKKLAVNATKDVLVICYNILLATKLKHRLDLDKIKVIHFHGWCMEMVKEYELKVPKDEKKQYFTMLEETVCQAVEDGVIPSNKYQAVLIDEGHDFSPTWLNAVSKLPDSQNEHLLLLYDDAQSIYDNRQGIDFTLSSVGIKARGRTTVLSTNYRNSQEILMASEVFICQFLDVSTLDDDDIIPLLQMQAGGLKTNEQPKLTVFNSESLELDGIIQQVRKWNELGINLGQIAILFYSSYFAKKLNAKLLSSGLSVAYLSNKKEKQDYKPTDKTITLCSIASSKGSEFSHVILAGLGDMKNNDSEKEKQARLIYVGMTRARNALNITTSKRNILISALEKSIKT